MMEPWSIIKTLQAPQASAAREDKEEEAASNHPSPDKLQGNN